MCRINGFNFILLSNIFEYQTIEILLEYEKNINNVRLVKYTLSFLIVISLTRLFPMNYVVIDLNDIYILTCIFQYYYVMLYYLIIDFQVFAALYAVYC